jgi:hypothetical protein
VTLNALVLVIPGDIAALLSGRRRFARARLEALGLGMIWLLAGMNTFAQYRLMLEASLRDDTMVAQLVWKLIVLITSVLIPRPARMSDADSARPAPDPGVHGRGRSRLGFHRPR